MAPFHYSPDASHYQNLQPNYAEVYNIDKSYHVHGKEYDWRQEKYAWVFYRVDGTQLPYDHEQPYGPSEEDPSKPYLPSASKKGFLYQVEPTKNEDVSIEPNGAQLSALDSELKAHPITSDPLSAYNPYNPESPLDPYNPNQFFDENKPGEHWYKKEKSIIISANTDKEFETKVENALNKVEIAASQDSDPSHHYRIKLKNLTYSETLLDFSTNLTEHSNIKAVFDVYQDFQSLQKAIEDSSNAQ
ncbi:MAG: hypothetical protein ACOYK6_01780 [Chthoniobacterales bacterium]